MSKRQDQKSEDELKKERILSIALGEGLKYGSLVGVAVTAGTVFASYRSKKFDKFLSLSARTSFPLITGLFAFSVKYELTMIDAQRYPENWGLKEYVEKGKVTNMPFHHRVLNAIYDNPFKMVAALGVPFAAYILSEQLKLKHLTLSQKIMHSRVIAQGGIISILLTTMMFKEYMDRNGRFPEPEEVE